MLETLGWYPSDGYLLLDRHLQRLSRSAHHFKFACEIDRVRDELTRAVAGRAEPLRVRLLLDARGETRIELSPLAPTPVPLKVGLASEPIDSSDPLFFHKTTSRARYERLRVAACDETILWNAAGEVTEALTANIVLDRHGQRVTPPVPCGLLPGTLRAELLDQGAIVEDIVTVDEFVRAGRCWLINSVRGWRDAVLDDSLATPG